MIKFQLFEANFANNDQKLLSLTFEKKLTGFVLRIIKLCDNKMFIIKMNISTNSFFYCSIKLMILFWFSTGVVAIISNCKFSKLDSKRIERCLSCQTDYGLSTDFSQCNLCKQTIPNCKDCLRNEAGNLNCQTCESGYKLDQNECVSLQKCTDPTHCAQCDVYNPSRCYYCRSGSKYNATSYQCSPCQVPGAIDLTGFGVCACPFTHLEVTTNNVTQCVRCGALCNKCFGTIDNCLACILGFYLSQGKCAPCPQSNCICDNYAQCFLCYLGFKLVDKKCIPQMNEHNEADATQNAGYLMPEFYKFCQPGCFYCTRYDFCQNCLDGYGFNQDNKSCIPCVSGCKHCQIINNIGCILCYENLQLVNGKCMQCQQLMCSSCSEDLATCFQCKAGYTVQNGSCVTCAANCLQCSKGGEGTCDQKMCNIGYARVSSTECVACAFGCSACSALDITKCVTCPIGSYQAVGGHCEICPPSCLTCRSLTYCSQCRLGYRLYYQMCVEDGIYPCNEMSPYSKICTSCFKGYELSDGQTCDADLSCNATSQCVACPYGYYLPYPEPICIKCNDQQNCIKCNMFPDRCSACVVGYYILQNTCHECNKNCTTCQLRDYCYSCISGFYLEKQSTSYGSCLPCSQKCLTCIDEATKCNSCFAGMKLMGFNCISTQTILFQITLQHRTISVVSGQKVAFIKEIVKFNKFLANTLGSPFSSNPSLLYLKAINDGSIAVSYMSSTESLDSLQLLEIITKGLQKMQKFQDFIVLDSQVVSDGIQKNMTVEQSTAFFIVSLVPAPIFLCMIIFMMREYITTKLLQASKARELKTQKEDFKEQFDFRKFESVANLRNDDICNSL